MAWWDEVSAYSPGFAGAQESIRRSPVAEAGIPGVGLIQSLGPQIGAARAADTTGQIQGLAGMQGGYNKMAAQAGRDQTMARAQQGQLIQQLQDQAAGRGPSLAQMQLQQGMDQNIGNAMALGYSQRGAGQAGMLKGIQGQAAGIGNQMANDSAMLRMQEQLAARSQLGGLLGGVRGQDINQQQYGMSGNTGLGLAQANLGMDKRRMDLADRLGWAGAGMQEEGMQDQRNQWLGNMLAGFGGKALSMVGGGLAQFTQIPGSGK